MTYTVKNTKQARLIVRGFSINFGLGEVAPGESARQVMHGDLIPGPWAYVFGLATVIDNSGGTHAEIAEQRREGNVIEAMLGDHLLINGRRYQIVRSTVDPHYVALELSVGKVSSPMIPMNKFQKSN